MDLDLGGVVPDPTEHARISPDGAVIVIRGTSNGTTGLHVRSIDGSRLSGLARD
jgi:hypothetical protein